MNLFAKVALDTRDWSRGINKMKSSSKSFGSQIGRDLQGRVASMFAVERVLSGFVSMYEKAADIRDSSLRFDTDTQTYQKMAAAAAKARVPVDRLYDAVKDLTVKQREAVNGSKTWMEVLERYGFQLEDLGDMAPVEMFQALSRAVSSSSQSMSQILADMDDLMSDPGAELMPFMQRGDFSNISSQKAAYSAGQVQDIAGAYDDINAGLRLGERYMLKTFAIGQSGIEQLLDNPYSFGLAPGYLMDKFSNRSGKELQEKLTAELREKENNKALKETADAVKKMAK
ncbi:hypothetical protein HN801_00680 [Candidatus Peregrinibacteria bacterium]|nr:hypothetical protein [Candidatus Peregrinibacteria bacterium]